MNMKKIIAIVVVVLLLGVGAYFVFWGANKSETNENQGPTTNQPVDTTPAATTTEMVSQEVIGTSVEGRNIVAYHYGTGDDELLFVGGIHGGYEWNTSLVAYEMIDYLDENLDLVPANVRVTVIPTLNPDGLKKVVVTEGPFTKTDVASSNDLAVAGRFNAQTVDLNRNFDCDWQAVGKWQNKNVSGGTAAFSEPESQALRDYVMSHQPRAAIVWYSAAGGVFASSCHNGVSTDTRSLMNTYAKASGYKAYDNFDFYEITGDAVNWLAKMNIPAISVLLTTHEDTEWTKNKAGIDALLKAYAR